MYPHQDAFAARETVVSADGTRLLWVHAQPAGARAHVLIVHGYGDHALRYGHVAHRLMQAGFAAHALDYRGHGHAGGRRASCGSWDEYLLDLEAVYARVEEAAGELPVFLLAHSHGGLMAASWLSRRAAPASLRGVVLSAPYFRLKIVPSAFERFLAHGVGKVLPHLGIRTPLTADQLTSDAEFVRATETDPLYQRIVTPAWFVGSQGAQERLGQTARAFGTPVLVVQGESDAVADPAGARRWIETCGSLDKRLILYPGLRHEVLNETSRDRVLDDVVAWIEAHLPSA